MKNNDATTVATASQVLSGTSSKRGLARLLPFLGPAFIASIAYVDPGNFATNIEGGAKFGYMLLWVVVASNLMAMLIQMLSAKVGIATGYNLAELCRLHFSRPLVWMMWGTMELVAIATDLAEFLGAALGLNLLFGMPLWIAGLVTTLVTFLILGLQSRGFRSLEMVITAMLGVIAVCYLVETLLDRPDWGQVLYHAAVPRFAGSESILLAAGILGATVMPHVIFLHSSLTQGRIIVNTPAHRRQLFRFELADVIIAMLVAGMVNAAMLMMAAATFHQSGYSHVASIEEAHLTLQPLLGAAAGWFFAISLLAAGLSSTTVGTMAGQIIMQGFLKHHIPVWLRRLVTILPSLVVIFIGLDPTRTLVISQVVLSFGLPFAVIPLILFTSRRDLMGDLVNSRLTTAAAWGVAALIILLNGYLLYQTLFQG
ncbi:Mn2+/Fe2+ transporter, NRAMP family [Candidatus Moduliflexus flocculans]|uniref:Divalent metal cation transporter MntH n=1 Tax=Candidatus Moduliflexus flocculans TaxID=1499966 RepID=A0A0S6VQ14_9BACT|nr:Mn2+/Fe2+ transporter, NRAMP family [Candidatus Moduliflexus flocculans]